MQRCTFHRLYGPCIIACSHKKLSGDCWRRCRRARGLGAEARFPACWSTSHSYVIRIELANHIGECLCCAGNADFQLACKCRWDKPKSLSAVCGQLQSCLSKDNSWNHNIAGHCDIRRKVACRSRAPNCRINRKQDPFTNTDVFLTTGPISF